MNQAIQSEIDALIRKRVLLQKRLETLTVQREDVVRQQLVLEEQISELENLKATF